MGRGGIRKGSVSDPMINIEPGDNTKAIEVVLAIKQIGKRKVNVRDPDEVQERIISYFKLMAEYDKKPTVNGLSMALGFSDRRRLTEILNDEPSVKWKGYEGNAASPQVRELIQWAYQVMSTLWEDYMQNGKINPASGIFLGKNFYGMRDEVEHVITPSHNPADDYNADDIAKRYIAGENAKVSGNSDDVDPWDDNFVPPDDPWDDIPPE